jgi:hypothetical protein
MTESVKVWKDEDFYFDAEEGSVQEQLYQDITGYAPHSPGYWDESQQSFTDLPKIYTTPQLLARKLAELGWVREEQ